MIAKQQVLVVDDEEIVRESFSRALMEAGYAVRTAGSGQDALRACREEPCDLMLADLKMPDMDGLQVTREVSSQFPNTRVVIVTGYPSPETLDEGSKLGILDYLEKPISPERLSAATASALARPRPSLLSEEEGLGTTALQEPEADAAPSSVEGATATAAVETPEPEARESVAKVLLMLALAPLMGLAFVIFLPMIGFGMLFAALASVLGESLRIGRA